jgi:hypothetical protein
MQPRFFRLRAPVLMGSPRGNCTATRNFAPIARLQGPWPKLGASRSWWILPVEMLIEWDVRNLYIYWIWDIKSTWSRLDPSIHLTYGSLNGMILDDNGIQWLSGGWFGTSILFFHIIIRNNHPNWLSYFSERLKPPTSYIMNTVRI